MMVRIRRALFWALATSASIAILAPSVATAAPPLSVTAKVSKSEFNPGQSVGVTGVARNTSGAVVKPTVAYVKFLRADGSIARGWSRMKILSNRTVTYSYGLPADAVSGTWTARVQVRASGGRIGYVSKRFGVVASPAPPTPDPSPAAQAAHADLTWQDYPTACRGCHAKQFGDVYHSLHYQWQAPAPDNVNAPGTLQGKMTNAVNSYCINITGDWKHCGKCHAGRGKQPVLTDTPTSEQLDNVDCLVCHNEAYALARVRKTDGSMGPSATDTATLDAYVKQIRKPTRTNCLKCHAYAGGGDSLKRGDITWAHKATGDRAFDVHMATTGANLACQSCHTFVGHKVTGKGSDLQSTDYASEIACTKCHAAKASATGHTDPAIGRHVGRVACQTCHIPSYARNASDTPANEATEVHRTWQSTESTSAPFHPSITKANNLKPSYRWWNRKSATYLLGDTATVDPETGAYPTSRPIGSVSDPKAKLYPFKYKTAEQPLRTASSQLIALDTWEFIWQSGNGALATQRGLFNMGFGANDAYEWVKTDTYQLLNHEVPPKTSALKCADCHGSTARMDLAGDLGYGLKGPRSQVCTQCHGPEDESLSFNGVHAQHVSGERFDCAWCHSFSRPERGLRAAR
ncbi:MAG: hypothetical protein HY876_10335 [Coriobacteriales bacterium]|nr:hypothetical protein [Coriobacteriales bacterium]